VSNQTNIVTVGNFGPSLLGKIREALQRVRPAVSFQHIEGESDFFRKLPDLVTKEPIDLFVMKIHLPWSNESRDNGDCDGAYGSFRCRGLAIRKMFLTTYPLSRAHIIWFGNERLETTDADDKFMLLSFDDRPRLGVESHLHPPLAGSARVGSFVRRDDYDGLKGLATVLLSAPKYPDCIPR